MADASRSKRDFASVLAGRWLPALGLGAAMLTVAPALAAEPEPGTCTGARGESRIQLTVDNVRSASGFVTVTVYGSDPAKFLASGAKVLRVRPDAVAPSTRICIAVPAAGVYALAVYHDENADRKFNRSLLGMPEEGYAFSNDAPTMLGLPKFDDVKMTVGPGDNPHRITMKY